MTELQDLSPESISSKNNTLEDSQDLLAESVTNLDSYNLKDDEGEIPQLIPSQKKRKKGRENIFNYYINLLTSQYHSSPLNNKILIIISLMIIISTLFIKLFIYFMMLSSLIKRIKKLHEFIFNRILDNVKFNHFLNIINYFFLVIGLIIYFIEMFCQFIIRYKTLLTINECSLKTLILSKCLFFISLGLIPEVIFANVPFKSKKNIFLSFYKMKLLIQPHIILILIIYFLVVLCIGNGITKKEKISNEIKSIKKLINGFVDKYIFVWNNFNEKDILIEEKEKKEEMEKEEESKNQNEETQKKNNELKRRKTIANFGSFQGIGRVTRKKRKGSKDENEDKSKHQKLLKGIQEDEDEEDEDKKKEGIFAKIGIMKNKVKLFFVDNIFTRMKKYIVLGIISFILLSPVINGIFGYGYYVFYDSQVDYCFQIDLALCFGYGFTLILLTNE